MRMRSSVRIVGGVFEFNLLCKGGTNMGFLGKMVAKAVARKVETAVVYGVDNYMEKTRSVNAFINKSTANYILIIKKKSMSAKRDLTVYDEFNNKKYEVKTDALTFGHPCIRLYDIEGHEIGKVKLTSKTGMGTYAMFLGGEKLGTISRRTSIKIRLDLNFNGWQLDGNFIKSNFAVTDRNGNQIMKLSDAYSSRETYVLEMNSREHEIAALLLVMAVELVLYGNN